MTKLYARIGRILFIILKPLMRPVLNRTERVYVAICYDGGVVLVKNWLAPDNWRFPGGGKQKNESEVDAAVREVKEELRIVLQPERLVTIRTGLIKASGLNVPYTLFRYDLNVFPKILASKLEIVDHGYFQAAPERLAPDFADVIYELTTPIK